MTESVKSVFSSRILVLASCLLMAATATFAQTKVGVVNFQKALLDTKEIQKKQADVEAKYKPLQDEIEQLQKDLQDIQGKLGGAQRSQLSPQAAADLQAQGELKQRQLQRRQEDLREEFDRDRTQILADAQRKLVDVVQKVAEAKGLDVVVDSANVVYSKPALDITAEVTAEYDKSYPAQ